MSDKTISGPVGPQPFHDNGDGTYSPMSYVANANPNGQASAANSAPVVLASDQLPQFATFAKAGKVFMASSGAVKTATNTNLNVCGLSVFNPSNSGKSLMVFSLRAGDANSSTPVSIRQTTVDPSGSTGFTNVITPSNALFGGANSVASACSSPDGISASVTPTGSLIAGAAVTGNLDNELLSNGAVFILPPGYGIELIEFVSTAGNAFPCTARWIEY